MPHRATCLVVKDLPSPRGHRAFIEKTDTTNIIIHIYLTQGSSTVTMPNGVLKVIRVRTYS